jgi:hypothetical protein
MLAGPNVSLDTFDVYPDFAGIYSITFTEWNELFISSFQRNNSINLSPYAW